MVDAPLARVAFLVLLLLGVPQLSCSSSSQPNGSGTETGDGGGGDAAGVDGSAAAVPDLRLAWVGAFASYAPDKCINVLGGTTISPPNGDVLTPVELGSSDEALGDGGAPTDAGVSAGSWEGLVDFTPALGTQPVKSAATSGDLGSMTRDLASLVGGGAVITSVDVSNDLMYYAAVAAGPAAGATYSEAAVFTGARASLDAWAEAQGERGGVVTALTYSATGLVAYSFARAGDPNVYETSIADATASTLQAQASTLAGGGYVISAFGRSSSTTIVLVGTRVRGASAARAVQVVTTSDLCRALGASLRAGFAVVGSFSDRASNTMYVVGER